MGAVDGAVVERRAVAATAGADAAAVRGPIGDGRADGAADGLRGRTGVAQRCIR